MFSGIGGIDYGFQQAGFDVAWTIEFNKDAATRYRLIFGSDYLAEADICSICHSSYKVFIAGSPRTARIG